MRMKIKNRILASVLSFLIIIATAFSGVTTAKAAEGDTNADGLKVGKSYLMPINIWHTDSEDGTTSLMGDNARSVKNNIAYDAIVVPEKSGKYKVTLEINNYNKVYTYQIYKQGTLPDNTLTKKINCATYGLDDYPAREEMVTKGWIDSENDSKCYKPEEITVTDIPYSANKCISFEVDNLKDYIYMNIITNVGYSWKQYNSDRSTSYDLLADKTSLDYNNAVEIPDSIDDYGNGSAYFDLVGIRSADTNNNANYGQTINSNLTGSVDVENATVNVKVKSKSNLTIKEFYIASTSESAASKSGFATRYRGISNWDKIEVNDNSVSVPFYNIYNAVFGKEVHIVMSDDSEYYATMKLSKDAINNVELNSNGVLLVSDSRNVNSSVNFEVSNITSGSDYETAMSTVGGISTQAKLYELSLKDANGKYTAKNRVRLEFDIPKEWNPEKTQLYIYYDDEKSSQNINSFYGTVEVIDGKLCYNTTAIDGYKYILFEKSDITDVSTLADGVYSVGVNIWNYESPDSPSMANNAVKGGKGKLYIYNNGANRDLYFDMQGITIPLNGESFFGYMYRMFYYPQKNSSDDEKKEVNIVKYMVNEKNSSDIDDYHLKYPESVAMPILETFDYTKGNVTLNNVFKINVIVPIMDGLVGGTPGDGASSRDALVQIFNAEKIDGESTHNITPSLKDVDKKNLKKYIDKANAYNSSDYDSAAFDEFSKTLKTSSDIYDDVNSTQEIVDKQVDLLISAIETLTGKSVSEYEKGVYTADARIVETDGTLGYHQGIAGDIRISVESDGTATVRMNVEKAKTVFDGQELASYYIDGFLYKSGSEYKQATVLDSIEEDGTKYPTLITFPLEKVNKLTQVGYYSDGDTSWVNEVALELTNIKKQDCDKTKLAALIDELSKLDNSAGIYTTDSFKALTDALKTAIKVNEDAFALKDEIDEQVANLNEANNNLKEVNASLNLSEGTYTVDSRIVETDGTLGYHQGIAGETTVVVDSDGNAIVYMDIEQAKTVFDGQVLASYNIDEFLYKDGTEYKQATVIDTTEIDGTKYPTKVSFPIGNAKKLTYVGFYSDGDTSWVNEIALELTNPKKKEKPIENGTYTIDGILKMASSDRNSMGNPAIVKPMKLVVDGDSMTLKMEFVPLTTKLGSNDFTGYLAKLNYYAGWSGGKTGLEIPDGVDAKPATVEEYYENIYDSYNDPTTGVDSNIKGQLYPHYISIPVESGVETIWVQVYVPVMESLQKGGGLQYARLMLDWTSLKSADDTTQDVIDMADGLYTVTGELRETDSDAVSAWNSYVDKVRLIAKDGKTTAYIDFKANGKKSVTAVSVDGADAVAVKDGRAVVVLPQNVEYTAVKLTDSTGANGDARLYLALRSAAVQNVNKAALKSYIDKANALKTDGKAYTDSTLKTLNTALAAAKKVYADEAAIQSEVGAAGLSLKNAVNGMKVKTDISPAVVSGLKNMTYTGKTLTQDKNITVTFNKKTLVQGTDYKVGYSKNKSRGTATVTITGIGNYTGTKTATFKIIQKVTPEVTLSKTAFAYTGKAVTPAVTVKLGGKVVSKTNYTVIMSSGRKSLGTYKVKVSMKGYYSGSKTVTFKIVPKGTSVAKTASGSKSFTVRWGAQKTQTTGYQIQYSTNSKFKSGRTATVSSNKTLTKKVTGLAANKKYYVRVRTYRKVGKTVYYSAWSKAVAVKTK